jgi:polar amino acid transport system substrate-binding protein
MKSRILTSAFAAVIVITACGSPSTPAISPTSSGSGLGKVDSIASQVPASMLALQPWQIAVDATSPPSDFLDPATGAVVGSDVELFGMLCVILGVNCKVNNVTFNDIIPQLKASNPRYLLSISFFPTQAREDAGIDFVTYYKTGESWLERVGGPHVSAAVDMCGRNMAVLSGALAESDAWGFMGKKVGGAPIPGVTNNCKAAGKPDIKVLSYSTDTQEGAALLSGRADFGWWDTVTVGYAAQQLNGSGSPRVKIAGPPCSVKYYGIAMVKGSPLVKPFMDAVKYLIDHGQYMTLLTKWGEQDGAIASSEVALNNNTTASPCVPPY